MKSLKPRMKELEEGGFMDKIKPDYFLKGVTENEEDKYTCGEFDGANWEGRVVIVTPTSLQFALMKDGELSPAPITFEKKEFQLIALAHSVIQNDTGNSSFGLPPLLQSSGFVGAYNKLVAAGKFTWYAPPQQDSVITHIRT